MRTRRLIVPAMFAASAIALAVGCTTEVVNETLPPYASISDEPGDRAAAPPPPTTDESTGLMSTIGDAITWPFRKIGDAFKNQ